MSPPPNLQSWIVSISIVGAALLETVSGGLVHAKRASIITRPEDLLQQYDFIVVGAGTAGLTVGDRLSESGEYTVLVVEYGYLDSSHSINAVHPPDVQSGPPDEYPSASRMYNITSVPQARLNNRTETVAAGALVGGSSAVNGMIFDRGSAEDYDAWVWAAGAKDRTAYAAEWGWDNMLPWFKKSARLDTPTPEMVEKYGVTYDAEAAYSEDGPVHASYEPYQFPKQRILWETFKAAPGVEIQKEHADGHAYGLIWVPNSINFATQQRSSAKTEHLDAKGAAGSRPNFHLLAGHRVTQVLMQERHKGDEKKWMATGVKITARGAAPKSDCYPTSSWNITATREVVVSAGALHTPQVLERSGIGAKDVLYAAGVPLRVNLPGVGWNLQDHMNFNMQWKYNKRVFPMPEDLQKNETFAAEALAEWNANKSGPYTARYNNGAFLSLPVVTEKANEIVTKILGQDVESFLPVDLDPTLVAGVKEMYKVIAKQYASDQSAVVEIPLGADVKYIVSLKVLSRGSIHIGPRDDGFTQGDEEPILDYRTFSNPIDEDIVIEIIKFIRGVMSSEPIMSTLAPEEILPGPSIKTDEEIGDWFLDNISPGRAHPVGTARIGPRELGGVLRPDLTVYATDGLSVADNSVIPIIVSAHTATSAYAIGEKAADLVLRRAKASYWKSKLPFSLD